MIKSMENMSRTRIYISLLLSLFLVNAAWGQTVTLPTSGTYTFPENGDVTLSGRTSLSGDLVIDLNGCTVRCPSGTQTFSVDPGQILTIKDSKGGGKFTGHTSGGGDRGGFIYLSGTLNLEGGTIQGFKTKKNNSTPPASEEAPAVNAYTKGAGGAVYINDGGIFNMTGGAITGCSTEYTNTAHTYTNQHDAKSYTIVGYGGAVFIDADINADVTSTFNFSGGIIKGCAAGAGGAVYVHAPKVHAGQAVFKMSGTAIIDSCEARYRGSSATDGGGAVMVAATTNGKGRFIMEGGTITSCKSAGHGCGVMTHGIMTMSGGLITLCHPLAGATDWSSLEYPSQGIDDIFGGGVYAYSEKCLFTMTGGTISYNKAASGAGVMVWGDLDPKKYIGKSVFTMDGTGVISNNQALGDGGLGNGGAVYVQTSVFNFKNGTLQGNKSVRYGGAININQGAELYLLGKSVVKSNIASHGGGISQEQGKCEMTLADSGILIDDNEAVGDASGAGNGGGIFIEKGTFTVAAGTISNNRASGCGGGASLRVERIVGDMTVNIIGGNISGNTAGKSGGGLDLFADRNYVADGTAEDTDNGPDHKNNVVVNFQKGTLSGNIAENGAGIYVHINEGNSTSEMTIGTDSDLPFITGNKASGNGGGLGMNHGGIVIVNGIFTDNHSDSGNGGAIYLGAGDFTVSGNANISVNSAKNGGGICVENGTVDIAKGTIEGNVAKEFGGGLYVYVTQSKTVSFSGDGVLRDNTAKNGGGVCVDGPLVVSIDATIEGNTAENGNGGGICLLNNAELSFGDGIIRNNKAVGVNSSLSSAFRKDIEELKGVGGGIFLDKNTKLSFEDGTQMGLYNNKADFAADDIFAYGDGTTTVLLPAVKEMELKDFIVPTKELFWIEDYKTDDVNYANGSAQIEESASDKRVRRYMDAIRELKSLWHLDDTKLDTFKSTYLCLALGYEQVYFSLVKKGLEDGDNAAFLISYPHPEDPEGDDEDRYIEYRKVYVYGHPEEDEVSSTVILPVGKWKIKETVWSSKYMENPDYAYTRNESMRICTDNSVIIQVESEKENVLTVTNKLKPVFKNVDIRDYENHKVNRMKP